MLGQVNQRLSIWRHRFGIQNARLLCFNSLPGRGGQAWLAWPYSIEVRGGGGGRAPWPSENHHVPGRAPSRRSSLLPASSTHHRRALLGYVEQVLAPHVAPRPRRRAGPSRRAEVKPCARRLGLRRPRGTTSGMPPSMPTWLDVCFLPGGDSGSWWSAARQWRRLNRLELAATSEGMDSGGAHACTC